MGLSSLFAIFSLPKENIVMTSLSRPTSKYSPQLHINLPDIPTVVKAIENARRHKEEEEEFFSRVAHSLITKRGLMTETHIKGKTIPIEYVNASVTIGLLECTGIGNNGNIEKEAECIIKHLQQWSLVYLDYQNEYGDNYPLVPVLGMSEMRECLTIAPLDAIKTNCLPTDVMYARSYESAASLLSVDEKRSRVHVSMGIVFYVMSIFADRDEGKLAQWSSILHPYYLLGYFTKPIEEEKVVGIDAGLKTTDGKMYLAVEVKRGYVFLFVRKPSGHTDVTMKLSYSSFYGFLKTVEDTATDGVQRKPFSYLKTFDTESDKSVSIVPYWCETNKDIRIAVDCEDLVEDGYRHGHVVRLAIPKREQSVGTLPDYTMVGWVETMRLMVGELIKVQLLQ